MARDFVAEIVSARSKKNPLFLRLVQEAEARRQAARRLAARREKHGLSQTTVAAMMRTSPSVVSKLEAGADVKLSTLQRYCAAIGEPYLLP
ncbi:MAG: helix-turn-helix domain-containing protein [Myxococcaceae bacterium]